jgi:tetratricopeptide (TPR) repeat protein
VEAGPLAVRIGIATGLVVVSSTEKGAVGETMNLAARLQAVAQPGSIVVSEAVKRLAGARFDYAESGRHQLKGIPEPVQVYQVLGINESTSRFDVAAHKGLLPLVGREEEIGLLMDRWATSRGGEGQVAVLTGEPGIGKSRIVNSACERVQAEGAQALRLQCSPYYVNSSFWPEIDQLQRMLRLDPEESSSAKLDKLEHLIVAGCGLPLSDVSFLASMLSIPCNDRYGEPEPMSAERVRNETIRAVADLIEAMARNRPSVVVFEDAHWADGTSLEVLDLIIDRARTIPLLVLVTHRPELAPRWTGQGHVVTLNLSKLSRAQSAAIVSGLTRGKPLPEAVEQEILIKTDGVPLYVEELTKSILESGYLTDAGDHYEDAGKRGLVAIPPTLRDSLMARLDRHPTVKQVAQVGAAIGREFSHELLTAVSTLPAARLEEALVQLTDSGLAFRRGQGVAASFMFKHALVQDAAYDSMLKAQRQELHRRIAAAIEERFPSLRETAPEMLARHYQQAATPNMAAALWLRAGRAALARSSLNDCVAHLDQGLAACDSIQEEAVREGHRLELLTSRGIAYMAMKGWPAPEVGRDLGAALPLARTLKRADMLVPILGGLYWNRSNPGPVRDSLPLVDEVFQEAKIYSDADLELLAHTVAVSAHFWLGELGDVVHHTTQLNSLYAPERGQRIQSMLSHDPKTVAQSHCTQALWALGFPDQALQMFESNAEHAGAMRNFFDYGFALSFGATMLAGRRDAARLQSVARTLSRVGAEQRLAFVEHVMPIYVLADAAYVAGHYEYALDASLKWQSIWGSAGGKVSMPYHRALCARCLTHLGRVDEAMDYIEQALEQIHLPGWDERHWLAEIMRIRGIAFEAIGNAAEAERSYLEALGCAQAQQARSWELRAATSLADLYRRQGRVIEGRNILAPVYDWFTEGLDTPDLMDAEALLSQLH